MKHTILPAIFIVSLIMTTASCTKEDTTPISTSSQVYQERPIYLVAQEWNLDQAGNFVCKFNNFMRGSAGANGATDVKVYLLTDNAEIMISGVPITYMSGQLWSEQEGDNLSVFYQPFRSLDLLPFEQLELKIEK